MSRKLLFFVEHFNVAAGGAENVAVHVCRALSQRGYDVHVAADTADAVDGIALHEGLSRIPEILSAVGPDITVDWGFFHGADVHRLGGGIHREFLKSNLAGCPKFLRWLKRLSYCRGKHRAIIRKEDELIHNREALFVAISNFVKGQAVRAGAHPDSVVVLYNGVDTKRFDPEAVRARRADVRQQWGLAEEDIAFLFVAHNLRLKNLRLLKRVFDDLSAKQQRLRLVVIGKRKPAFSAPYLIYAGATGQVEYAYGGGDALLHPSYFDTFGNVVLEALSCGLPVVVSDQCGASELIEEGENGFVLPVTGDGLHIREWSDAVSQLAGDDTLRHSLGAAGRRTALKHGYETYVDRFEAYVRQVYETKAGRSSQR